MASGSVRLHGYRETMRALRKCEKGARDAWKDAFKELRRRKRAADEEAEQEGGAR